MSDWPIEHALFLGRQGAPLKEIAETARNLGVKEFADAILHGDDKHREWLLEAAEAYCSGKPMPKVKP